MPVYMIMLGIGVFAINCFTIPSERKLIGKLTYSPDRTRQFAQAVFGQLAIRARRHPVRAMLCIIALTGCASPQPPVIEEQPKHWSFSQTVQTDRSMITLFDPADLSHHEVEPADWYRYDFSFANDLETGRFVAVLTGRPGKFDVRLTSGPLSVDEQRTAGARASMRLRVIDHRLLLAGGDAWPSDSMSSQASAHDARWVGLNNGDYEVIITVLDRQQQARHDYVIQLLPVEDIALIPYAPGIPHLVVGEPAGVAGINAGGLHYQENCSNVPETAVWSPLTSSKLPLPGSIATIDLAADVHRRGTALKAANEYAALPIVIAREPIPGAVGLFIRPDTWKSDAVAIHGEVSITTQVLCAVKITGLVPSSDAFELQIEPLPGARDTLDAKLSGDLISYFESWITQISDPAWRYKSGHIQRTGSDHSLILGIMEYLNLSAKYTESMLGQANSVNAIRLLDRMSDASKDVSR